MNLRYLWILFFLFFSSGVPGQNAPVSTLGSVSVYGSSATVPVTVTNFNNIANCLLEIHYDTGIAVATGASANPQIGGGLFVNLNTPGVLILSWYTWPGVNLPDNSLLFQLSFQRNSYGTASLNWYNEGFTCIWGDGNSVELTDIPTENFYVNGSLTFKDPNAPHVILPVVESCASDIIEVPVKITNFNNIGTLHLSLWFEHGKLLYHSWVNPAAFPNLSVVQISPGVMDISGFTNGFSQGITLNDSAVLFTLKFYNVGGDAYLQWYDDGPSCQFTGPAPEFFILNDEPGTQYYIDGGSVTMPLPGPSGPIQGPSGGNVCSGQTGISFFVPPIANASHYNWSFPSGFIIIAGMGTNQVVVEADPGASSGLVTVFGQNGCGSGAISDPFALVVHEAPVILNQPVSAGPVAAGSGSAGFMVDAVGEELVFQWQEYDGGWNDLSDGGYYSGSKTSELTVSHPLLSMNGRYYRCWINGLCTEGMVTDGNAQLYVSPPVGTEDSEVVSSTPVIYPNPLKHSSQVSVVLHEKCDLVISFVSMDGTELNRRNYPFCSKGKNLFNIDPGNLSPGIYLLKIEIRSRDHYRCYPIKCLVNNDFR